MPGHDIEPLVSALVIGAGAWFLIRRTLPTRHLLHGGAPLPHLAGGPRVAVRPARYPGGQRSRVLAVMTWTCATAAVGFALAGVVRPGPELTGLGIAATIVTATMAFSQWFAGRVHIRVDSYGVHSRVLIREHTLAWNTVSGLRVRYVILGSGARLVYYCVLSPHREVAFPSSMQGADTLRATIAAATALEWPEPEVQATL